MTTENLLFDIRSKYKVDFSLVPLAVIILELAVMGTEIAKASHNSTTDIIVMRLIHTIILLFLASGFSRLLSFIKKNELTYFGSSFSGFAVISIGILLHRILANAFHVEALSVYRNIATGFVQGFFWFPLFIAIGSRRTEIFHAFRDYEQRLITATRASSRTSEEFRNLQVSTHEEIRLELFTYCKQLRNAIAAIDTQRSPLPEANSQLQTHLLGNELRRLSMRLETFGSEQESSTYMGQNTRSVKLLISQFRALYSTVSRIAPLRSRHYSIVLLVLIAPAYINYFSLAETLVSLPLITLAIIIFSHLVTKSASSGSPKAMRNSSILIYATGLLPLVSNQIGQAITHDPRTAYPIYIGALTLPASYYIFMKFLQVLQPHAIELIRSDQLVASSALRNAVTTVVSNEFSHTLAHRWAIYIHGKILTRLAATSLRLETASSTGDRNSFIEAIETLLQLLDYRLDPWFGLLDIDLQIEPGLMEIRNSRVQDLGEVIEELVSNSIRHGKAQKIALKVRRMGDKDIQVTAIDDAIIAPPAFQSRFGLGTRIFNLASDGRWTLMRVGSTTELNLLMTIES